ncbi:MAG: hypothetical protein IVW52_05205 [Acidimicrobiales bacterium]|nr:hypothetical protein [Acidimicrobiales bacterium]
MCHASLYGRAVGGAMPDGHGGITVYLDKNAREELRKLAEREKRSLSAQAAYLIGQGLERARK